MNIGRAKLVIGAVLAAQAVLPGLAQAQTTAPTRDELDRNRAATIDPTSRSRLTVEGDVERAPCPLADPRYADVRVTFSAVSFSNLQGIDAAMLDDSWRDFAGKSQPIATVCEIRDRAATSLRRMGYLAAVQVVPQRIEENGTVQFDVLLAKLVSVQVRGNAGNSERQIARYLSALTDQPLFNVKAAERYLLLARDMPGFDVRLSLRPAGTNPGEVIGEVSVTRHRFEVDANAQNYGSPDVGRFGGMLRAQVNGLTGLGDRTYASIFNTVDTREQTILQGGHSFVIGRNGLRLSADVTHAWTSPSLVPAAPIKSRTLVATLAASYPVVRSQGQNLVAGIGFDLIDQDVDFAAVPLTQDKLRILFARADFDRVDPFSLSSTTGYSANEPRWRVGGSIELRQGLGGLGASKPCGAGFVNCLPPRTPLSRIEGDPSAFVARALTYVEFRPVPTLTLAATTRAQYAPDPLVSYEEFSLGNYTVGRGYFAGTLLGDSGIGVQSEVRINSIEPSKGTDIAVQPYAFFDAARVWNKDRLNPAYPAGRTSLYSAGGGLRAAWGNHARLDVALAIPLRRAGLLADRGEPRLLISLTTKLLPWNR